MNAAAQAERGSVAPPHSLEAEQSVLGGVLLSDRALRGLVVEEGLRPEHFYRERHRLVWEAMVALSDSEHAVDVLTVTEHLRAAGRLQAAGGEAAIDELTGDVPGLGGIRRYAQIVIDQWRWRERLASAYEQIEAIVSHAGEAAHEEALQRAHNLAVVSSDARLVDPEELRRHMLRWVDEKPQPGLPTPVELPGLGRMVRLRAGHVTIVSGWSHQGKTVLAGQLLAAIGAGGHRAVVWTNEDTPEELAARHLNRATGVPATRIADRDLDLEQSRLILAEPIPFGVQPCFGWDARQIARHIRQVRPDVAVIDHLHAMPGVSRTDDVDAAMQTLVAAAGQTPCHLIVVCQLNQQRLKDVVRPAPVARDLRGTGQIFNLAHTVILVYRQEEELCDTAGRKLGRPVQLERGHLDVVKNKPAGKLGAVHVRFDERRLRFVEEAEEPAPGSVQDFGF